LLFKTNFESNLLTASTLECDSKTYMKRKHRESIFLEQDSPVLFPYGYISTKNFLLEYLMVYYSEYESIRKRCVFTFHEYDICNWCGVMPINRIDRIHFEIRLWDIKEDLVPYVYILYADVTIKYVLKPDETYSLLSPEILRQRTIQRKIGTYNTFLPKQIEPTSPEPASTSTIEPAMHVPEPVTSRCSSCSSCWLSVKNCFRRLFS
jgi:hypothetical protein